MDLALQRLGSRLGYQFSNVELLKQALTHRSSGTLNNERLEFLGDALLGAVIASWLYHHFADASEGDLTRMRSLLVRRDTLARVGKRLEIGSCLQLGGGELKSGGHRRASIVADTVEALIGAIYLESGLDSCRQCIESWFLSELQNVEPGSENRDAKTRLQEYLQANGLELPLYTLVATEGEPHNQQFTVTCSVSGLAAEATGRESSRRRAEQNAAEKVLAQIAGGGR